MSAGSVGLATVCDVAGFVRADKPCMSDACVADFVAGSRRGDFVAGGSAVEAEGSVFGVSGRFFALKKCVERSTVSDA
jgi:hypothetical protein